MKFKNQEFYFFIFLVIIALMNKNLLIVVGIGLAVALGVGGFFLLSNKTDTGESVSNSEQTTSEAPDSLRKLLSLTNGQECSFKDEEGNEGTIYGSSGKVRGDFVSNVNGTVTNNHMIISGQDMYFWYDGAESGFKTSLETYEGSGESNSQKSVDLDKKVDYDCKNWREDASKFTLPEMDFMDYSSLLPSELPVSTPETRTQENSEDGGDACSACDSLSGEAKTQCLQVLGC